MQRRIAYKDRHLGEPLVPRVTSASLSALTSVPMLFTWLVPKSGERLPAALLHDGLIHPLDGLPAGRREAVDFCRRYLTRHFEPLRYDVALAAGWPTPTGAIEGASRQLTATVWTSLTSAETWQAPKPCSGSPR
ncbi:DUF1353 domain-containing protein [Streptomyces sp. NPDC046909]|uniref:DUF1353 domain-containing protein n=1 Tax=Streptomyces sp. NPDC046909 TaxID=3155617 RepID=UPI0034027AF2